MRNDAHDDFDDVPTLRAGTPDDDELLPARVSRNRQKATRPASTGPLWALLGASFIALAGLGWWSFQQISLMEQQLVATQESFARISEEAAGRLQAISGKVAATESSTSTGSEALKLQIRQLQASLAEQGKQQQGVAGQTGDLGKRLEQVLADTREQQKAVTELQTQLQAQLKAVNAELAALKSGQVDGGKLDGQLKSLSEEVAALKKQGNPKAAIESLEQDVLVLKSQVDNRPAAAPASGASVQEFDAFRGQTTRNFNTLQSQIQNLQQQINARP
ncbi:MULTISPECIES: ATPase [Pseudomonas]|jgi:chromosome segregation ATPase|uniref:ATPase n=1 Tax=Pseudomonas putida TaxID=303 RepID=A0A379KI35_PSEPU|nr:MULTISPECIES: ATPase [Pseudomonas]QPN46445.1 ATPase [Priestia aryabhattai]KAF1307486.1 ATPase [Pseudomonas sp. SG-MS2]MBG6124523.1 chromosome segregation ATPase [Pseudomonas sp. M2]MBM7399479.1 chromosome segregation ATPase [Pseudomonas sp. M5]NSX21496.1 ATPase [Pseudomonas putida]